MGIIRNKERKPLLFTTTIRNPYRIVSYLKCLVDFDGYILSNDIIMRIIRNTIKYKVYCPIYINKVERLNQIYKDEELSFSNDDIEEIILNSPQKHKEAGFDEGWESRFDTIFKFIKELGFIYYNKGERLILSKAVYILLEAAFGGNYNEAKIENIFLNAMMKYQLNNPLRKNLNQNKPLLLLLKVLKLLKNKYKKSYKGLFRKEISLFLCYPSDNAEDLCKRIIDIRKKYNFFASDEIYYDECLGLLEAREEDKKRFKMSRILKEGIDEYIRKMKITGLISLRGMGKFIDFNSFEQSKIDYILLKYDQYFLEDDELSYFKYMAEIDDKILEESIQDKKSSDDLRQTTLNNISSQYTSIEIENELELLSKRKESKDTLFRYMSEPLRFEFLVSILLNQKLENTIIQPNYAIDDEGMPRYTASGGIADIICIDKSSYNALFEVSLLCDRAGQINNEMLPIVRHLKEYKVIKDKTFSVFIAPKIHPDVMLFLEFLDYKSTNDGQKLLLYAFNIEQFIVKINSIKSLGEMV